MRPARVLLGAAALALVLAGPLLAEAGTPGPRGAVRSFIGRVADSFGDSARGTASEQHPTPQAIPAADAGSQTIDLHDLSAPSSIDRRLRPLAHLAPSALRVTVAHGQARLGDFSVGSEQTLDGNLLVLRGNADVFGTLRGNVVAYEGDVVVHAGGRVEGDVLAVRGAVRNEGGTVTGVVRTVSAATLAGANASAELGELEQTARNLAGVLGVFLTAVLLGASLVFFGRPQLEVVSDTVAFSFVRSFVVGVLGQILLVPTFGMVVVGLVLSVAGILLVPFAVVAFLLLLVVGVVGGTLAVAHAMGETYTRRRLARGEMMPTNSYRYVLLGLALPCALWLAWAAFSWVPVAGELMRWGAVLVTWLLVTLGFGSALLSRAGIRANFAGRFIPAEALTDEYLWATPQFGVPAVRRPSATSTRPQPPGT